MKRSLACLAAVVFAGQVGTAAEIKIGVVAELTGDMPAVGASCKQAALMAVDEVNNAGGLKVGGSTYTVDLEIEDNAAKADQSALAAQKLIAQDRVLAIIGPNASLGAVPASAIAEGGRTVMITPWSTNPKTTRDMRTGRPKRYVFRACYTDTFEGHVLAMFILNQLKLKRAAVLYDVASEAPTSQSELFRRIFTEKGGVMTAFETYTTGDRDFSAQLTKIKESNPDIIFLPSYYNDVPLVVTQAKRLGVTVPFLGSDAWSSPELITLSQGTVEGYYFANHYAADIATPAAQAFIQAYKARYKALPDDVAALTYDAFGLLFQALKQVDKPEREALRNALSSISRYEGVTGNMRFQEGSGDPIKSAVILQVKNGRFVWFANANP
ncbi:MAG: ABC transporter substrate-binding protein [Kiritimatiellae bacterium]|nr:ABC transporter substrate-binding protein [Kiritimatiellia bacterium]